MLPDLRELFSELPQEVFVHDLIACSHRACHISWDVLVFRDDTVLNQGSLLPCDVLDEADNVVPCAAALQLHLLLRD